MGPFYYRITQNLMAVTKIRTAGLEVVLYFSVISPSFIIVIITIIPDR